MKFPIVYTITLSDGRQIKDLTMNGNTYVAPVNFDLSIFTNNLTRIEISDGETRSQYENMQLTYFNHVGNQTWFVLGPVSELDLRIAKIRSNIDYIAMMTGTDILD